MIKKKYLVIGGYVRSKMDGDIHYISAPKLCKLYGVNIKECVLKDGLKEKILDIEYKEFKGRTLYPKHDGDYSLNENK